MTRRYFFFGSLALAGCSRQRLMQGTREVSVVRCPNYSDDIASHVRQILTGHCVAVKDRRIVLKPNLVEFDSGAAVNTNPVFVAAVSEAFRSLGAADVRIAEGPGHRRATMDLADAAGYFGAVRNFEDRFTDLNLDDHRFVPFRNSFSRLKGLHLPKTVLDCDLLVSLPKMKTHHWAGATLSMKNLFGVVPGGVYGWPKNVLHWAGIHESIADLFLAFPRQFAIVDGIQAMEGNGPILGTVKHAGVLVAGAHPPSVDATCCRVMGIDPGRIGYLRYAAQRTGWNERIVRQTGEAIRDVHTEFALIPDFQNLRLRPEA